MFSMRQGRISDKVLGVFVTSVFQTCTAAERTEKPTSERARYTLAKICRQGHVIAYILQAICVLRAMMDPRCLRKTVLLQVYTVQASLQGSVLAALPGFFEPDPELQ